MHMLQCMLNRGDCDNIAYPILFFSACQHLRSRLFSHYKVDQSKRVQFWLPLSWIHA